MGSRYKAIMSSDWSECLAPGGPFDFIAHNYPSLQHRLTSVFQQYTSNRIPLRHAVAEIEKLLPDPLGPEHIDAYLDASFETYTGVPDLIEWCLSNRILFMINTTGMIGYFQRVFARGLLPPVPILSANPMVRFPQSKTDPPHVVNLFETGDKAKNTAEVIRSYGISSEKVILMGDSGGDGPHFEWGAKTGAFLIGSMTKPSLAVYCREKGINISLRFGRDYSRDEKKDPQADMQFDFMELAAIIAETVNR